MLSTINGFDLLLLLIIGSLITYICLLKAELKFIEEALNGLINNELMRKKGKM